MYDPPKEALSAGSILVAFQEACEAARLGDRLVLRRLVEHDVDEVASRIGADTSQTRLRRLVDGFESSPPLYHGFMLDEIGESSSRVVGFAICYLAYSTWEGRVLFLNYMDLDESVEKCRRAFMRVLANAALNLECKRLVWNHYSATSPIYRSIGAQMLDGWLTLRMDREGIESFVATRPELLPSDEPVHGPISVLAVGSILDKILTTVNTGLLNSGLRLKRALHSDVPSIQRLVQGLAEYEKEPDAVNVTGEQLRLDGFDDTKTPLYYCLLLEDVSSGRASGLAFAYIGYDALFGRFIYLEDLFFEESSRGKGAGTMVMFSLAALCQVLGCEGFVWQALHWNTPALTFYRKIGAKVQDGLLTTRFAGQDLVKFASM